MKQFDFYPFEHGFLLNVQSDVLCDLKTRLVVPLIFLDEAPLPAKKLNPIFQIGEHSVAMVTQFMSAVDCTDGAEAAGSLSHEHFTIKAALDMAFDGF